MTDRKDLIQDIEDLAARDLLAVVQDACTAGYRLGQICATSAGDTLEILYTFEKNNILKSYKVVIDAETPELQSISAIYSYSFIYENEMHDLFGVAFKNLSLDYGGNFFKIAKETPWNPAYKKGGKN